MNHEEKLADGHPYVHIAPYLNFCGHYSKQYGHCGCTIEEHEPKAKED